MLTQLCALFFGLEIAISHDSALHKLPPDYKYINISKLSVWLISNRMGFWGFGVQARIFKRKNLREHAQQRRRVLHSAQCLQRDCVRDLRIQLEEQRAQRWIEAGHPGGAAAM